MKGLAEMGEFAEERDRLPADPGHQAADARLRAERLARRARRLDRREVPHLERLRRRRRDALQQGRAAHQRDDLLGHRDDQFVRRGSTARPCARAASGAAASASMTPTGCAIFPKELYNAPRRWAEAQFNLVQWTMHAAGGHFAALEEPAALVEDVRSLFRKAALAGRCGGGPPHAAPSQSALDAAAHRARRSARDPRQARPRRAHAAAVGRSARARAPARDARAQGHHLRASDAAAAPVRRARHAALRDRRRPRATTTRSAASRSASTSCCACSTIRSR